MRCRFIFLSRWLQAPLENHPDQPEWLSLVNAGVLKVKLATALIGISSIHLLKSFIEAEPLSDQMLMTDRPTSTRADADARSDAARRETSPTECRAH